MRDRERDARQRQADEALRDYEISRRRVLEALGVSAGVTAISATGVGRALGAVGSSADGGSADLILHSGTIWTGVRGPSREAVAIKGQRIVAVGSDREVLAWADGSTRSIDLRGAFVAPGFRDQHAHILRTLSTNPATYQPRWTGHDEAASFESRRRTGQGHVNTYNAGRTPSDGAATHGPVTELLRSQILTLQEEAAKLGISTIVDAGLTNLTVMDALMQLHDEGRLKVRHLIRWQVGAMEAAAQLGWTTGFGNDWIKVLGVKMYADGWLGPRTCALREPYADDPYEWGFPNGILFLAQDRANRDVARAQELGYNITAHAIGDRGVETMLNAYDLAGVTQADRWALEHVQVAGDDLLDRMAAKGVVASIQLSFPTSDHWFAFDALGKRRAQRESYRWHTMLRRGLHVAGGTDFSIEVLDPLWGIQRSVTRREFDGSPSGGFLPEESVTVDDALQLITANDAFASYEEDDRGTIETGKYADLVVMRENLQTIPRMAIANATRLMTITNGKIVSEGEVAYPPGDATKDIPGAPSQQELADLY